MPDLGPLTYCQPGELQNDLGPTRFSFFGLERVQNHVELFATSSSDSDTAYDPALPGGPPSELL